jgi:uncharacterized membrane protein
MEIKAGQLARLSDGQPVKIEIVHDDGYATVRRTKGRWAGEVAVCEVSRLQPFAENLDSPSDR